MVDTKHLYPNEANKGGFTTRLRIAFVIVVRRRNPKDKCPFGINATTIGNREPEMTAMPMVYYFVSGKFSISAFVGRRHKCI